MKQNFKQNFFLKSLIGKILLLGTLSFLMVYFPGNASHNKIQLEKQSRKQLISLKETDIKILNKIEKINAAIEEQVHLLATLNPSDENLNIILNNLDAIEIEARHNDLYGVVNNPDILDLRVKINIYKKVDPEKRV